MDDRVMYDKREHFENHCQLLEKYFYKYNTKIFNRSGKDTFIVQDVLKLNDDEKDKKMKDASIFSTLFGTHSRRFKSKMSMFKQANSYENLYLIDYR